MGASERREDFSLTLGRYAVERFLYRISISDVREQFVLKGALLFELWFDEPHRPTRDADFLGSGEKDAETLTRTIRAVCAIHADDGMSYDRATVTTTEIREEANYGGLRVKLRGRLGKADSAVQLDVGYGDAVTPAALEVELPRLLDDQPAARLRAYPRETVVAEKLEAIVKLGMINSRMKDYFDLHALRRENATDEHDLVRAIAASFRRRGTPIPEELPAGLSREFAHDRQKQAQWSAFLTKNRLASSSLEAVVESLAVWLLPTMREASKKQRGRGP
ncbi:MAG: nucleotidyl transferase AbiEii/AbiGii toxin family protein [Myxococcota bacterium]